MTRSAHSLQSSTAPAPDPEAALGACSKEHPRDTLLVKTRSYQNVKRSSLNKDKIVMAALASGFQALPGHAWRFLVFFLQDLCPCWPTLHLYKELKTSVKAKQPSLSMNY